MARASPGSDARDSRPSPVRNERGLPSRGRGGLKRQVQADRTLKIATLNVGTMTGKRHEIVKMMMEKNIEILCVQETKWAGSKAYGIGNGFKIFYHGHNSRRNGVGIIVSPDLKDKVIEVGRKSDRVMHITVEIEGEF